MDSNYKEQVIQLRGQLTSMLPAEIISCFDQEAEQMQKEFQDILKVKAGQKAPDFTLPNAIGKMIKLNDLLKQHLVVLVFYRGAWCPYCNLQLAILQKELEKFKQKGATLVAVSLQNPDATLSLVEKQDLKFDVLTDAHGTVTRQFTHIFKMSEASLNTLSGLGYDFDSFYADDSKELPVPAVFVIAKDGTVLFAKSQGGDYRSRVEAHEILDSIQQ